MNPYTPPVYTAEWIKSLFINVKTLIQNLGVCLVYTFTINILFVLMHSRNSRKYFKGSAHGSLGVKFQLKNNYLVICIKILLLSILVFSVIFICQIKLH